MARHNRPGPEPRHRASVYRHLGSVTMRALGDTLLIHQVGFEIDELQPVAHGQHTVDDPTHQHKVLVRRGRHGIKELRRLGGDERKLTTV